MQIWMSPSTRDGARYGRRMLLSVAAIVLGMLALMMGGAWFLLYLDPQVKAVLSLVWCLGATALAVWCAVRLGRRSLQDTLIFWLDDTGRLYAVDVRTLLPVSRSLIGHAAAALQTDRMLEEVRQALATRGSIANACEIVGVEHIRENRHDYAVRCQIRRGDSRGVQTYLIVKGYEDEDLLLMQLERRRIGRSHAELHRDRAPLLMLAGTGALILLVALCVLSHPAVGLLPQTIYFPCLGLAMLPIFLLVYLAIKRHRGE